MACFCTGKCRDLGYCPNNVDATPPRRPMTIVPGMNDPMTTETARMFYERAIKAEAEVKRLQAYVEQMPYPSDVFQLVGLLEEALRGLDPVRNADAYKCVNDWEDALLPTSTPVPNSGGWVYAQPARRCKRCGAMSGSSWCPSASVRSGTDG